MMVSLYFLDNRNLDFVKPVVVIASGFKINGFKHQRVIVECPCHESVLIIEVEIMRNLVS